MKLVKEGRNTQWKTITKLHQAEYSQFNLPTSLARIPNILFDIMAYLQPEMKRLSIILTMLMLGWTSYAQEANPKDVDSIDNIIAALYDVISGPAGEKRDWDRMRSLFIPEGRLMPTGKNQQTGKTGYRVWTVDEYITTAGGNLEKSGFFEQEIARTQEQYGTLVHLFSTYESRRNADDPDPFVRGINSIQLMHDGSRWWIVSVFWLGETPDNQIPKAYLPKN